MTSRSGALAQQRMPGVRPRARRRREREARHGVDARAEGVQRLDRDLALAVEARDRRPGRASTTRSASGSS